MKRMLNGSLILLAAVALLATGCGKQVLVPKELARPAAGPGVAHCDVAEVVVTAERPGWLMPEVLVTAERPRPGAVPASVSTLPYATFVN